ncbi:MAG: hypothetical protein AAFU67_00345 [Bacteroidota bacterium]
MTVNRDVAKIVKGRSEAVGMYLNDLHKEEMFRYVSTRVEDGFEALGSVARFFDKYNINEDDYSLESAARLFRRWSENYGKIRMKNIQDTVRHISSSWGCVKLSYRQADNVARRVMFFGSQGAIKFDRSMKLAIRSYVLYNFTDETLESLAEKENRKHQNIYRSCKRAFQYMRYNPQLYRWIAFFIMRETSNPIIKAS